MTSIMKCTAIVSICILVIIHLDGNKATFELSTIPNAAIQGDDFSFICSYVNSNVEFRKDDKLVCIIIGYYANKTCKIPGSYNTNYSYRCDSFTYSVTIPGQFMIETLHGSKWECLNVFNSSQTSGKKELYINVPITVVTLSNITTGGKSVKIIKGQSKQFTCSTDAGRPFSKIQWYISSDNITSSATSQSNVCATDCSDGKIISSSQLMYTGNTNDSGKIIYCTASNLEGHGVVSTNKTIDVLYFPYIHMEPNYNPYIVYHNQQNIVLTCVIDGANPVDAVTYQWESPIGTINTQNLTISTVNRSHSGQYLCTATNIAGTSEETTKQINVHYGPLLSNIINQSIMEGKNLIVTPVVQAYPGSRFVWWTRQKDLNFRYNGPVLNINAINRTSSDNYTCNVMNTLNPSGMASINRTSQKIFYVNVQFGPFLDYTRRYSSSDISAIENDTILITITITANPTPTIEWTFMSKTEFNSSCSSSTITSNTTTNAFTSSSSVLITNVQRQHFGEYTVTARNTVGIFFRRFVIVEGKAIPPSIVYVVCKSTYAIVIWKHSFNKGNYIDFFIQYDGSGEYVISKRLHLNQTDQPMVYTVNDLTPNRKYNFIIVAVDSLSEFKSEKVECLTDKSCLQQETCDITKGVPSMFLAGVTTLVSGCFILTAAVICVVRNSLQKKVSKSSKSHEYTDTQRTSPAFTEAYSTLQSEIELRPFQNQSKNAYEECVGKSEEHAYLTLTKLEPESKLPEEQRVNTYEKCSIQSEGHAYSSLNNIESGSEQPQVHTVNTYEECKRTSDVHAYDTLSKQKSGSEQPQVPNVNTYEECKRTSDVHAYDTLSKQKSGSEQPQVQTVNTYEECKRTSDVHAYDTLSKQKSGHEDKQKKQGVYNNLKI